MMKTIVRMMVLAALVMPTAAIAQGRQSPAVSGVVTDTDGDPLPLARVRVVGLERSTVADREGRFTLRNLPPGRHRIEVSLLGHAPEVREVTAGEAGAEIRIALTPTPLSIAGVSATANATGSDPLAVARSTSQLSGRALERALAGTVAQTLARQPGIAVRYNGPAAAAPVMRGLTGDRVLVLQDGQRAGDLSGSAADHAVTIDPLAARRIEVVRGPASLLYGNNALGGVVNVISDDVPTSVPDRPELMLAGQAESASPGGGASMRASVGIGEHLALTARAGMRSNGDVRIARDPSIGGRLDNTEMRTRHAALGAAWVGERVSGGVSVRGFDFAYGLPYPLDGSPIRLDGRRWDASARVEAVPAFPSISLVRLDATVQDYAHDELDATGAAASTFALKTRTAGLAVRQGRLGPFAEGAWGATALAKEYTSTGTGALTPPVDSRSWGVFGYQEARLGERGPSLQVGARYDRYHVESHDTEKFGAARSRTFGAVSGSLGVSVPLGSGISGGVSAARAFRAPTVEEMFSGNAHAGTGAVEYGNPDLRPEYALGLDAVLRIRRPRLSAEVAGYVNRVDDYVYPALRSTVRPGETDSVEVGGEILPVFVYTQSDVTLRGLEGMVEWVAAERWVVGLMGDVVRGGRRDGEPIPFLPPARLGASLRWDDGRRSLGGEVRHAFAQGRVAAEDGAPTEAYTLFDLSAGIQVPRGGAIHSVTLRADNVTNVLYRDATSRIKHFAPNPGRNVSLVYRLFF
jgi:iron complex outermembrane receptor protein